MRRKVSSGAAGGRHGEVKEEDRAQPDPGDMSGVGHPPPPVPHDGPETGAYATPPPKPVAKK